jgi:hypothetical protein
MSEDYDALQLKLERITEAIRDYHLALDNREHGGLAQDACMKAIENVLGLYYFQGQEKRRRAELENKVR